MENVAENAERSEYSVLRLIEALLHGINQEPAILVHLLACHRASRLGCRWLEGGTEVQPVCFNQEIIDEHATLMRMRGVLAAIGKL